jgi:hypothetical protein
MSSAFMAHPRCGNSTNRPADAQNRRKPCETPKAIVKNGKIVTAGMRPVQPGLACARIAMRMQHN